MYGWCGKILYVDLSRSKVSEKPLSDELRARFIGGRGINAKLLWDIAKPGVEPFSPENPLIFGTGPLTGTIVPMTGRATVTTKSPATGLYVKSSMGGHFAGELKFAGYDHIVILGRAKNPTMLWIDDGDVELVDASHLWGKDVRETDMIVKKDLGDRDVKVASIGPAGERMVKFASIMNSVYNACARAGVGAVMGFKRLKAIAVRGTGSIKVKDPERLWGLVFEIVERLKNRPFTYGTSELIDDLNEKYMLPSYNFRKGHIEGGHNLSGRYFAEAGYLRRKHGCFSCIIGCHLYNVVEKGPYAGYAVGPEYEAAFSLGSNTGVTDTEALLKANELCNIYGLDAISTGVVIAWAMESYERGILTKEETDGLDLRFGNGEALVKLVHMIAFREGNIGNLLAEGVKRAAEKVGKESYKWAMCNSKGLEHSGIDTRTWSTRALTYSVNPRGPDHLFHQIWPSPELAREITGLDDVSPPLPLWAEARIVKWYGDHFAVTDALGICKFSDDVMYTNAKVMSDLYSAVTGVDLTPSELLLIGTRIYNLERCYNVREGFDRRLDDLPWRLMHEPVDWKGIPSNKLPYPLLAEGGVNSPERLREAQDEYYRLQGWDLKTGWPLKDTLVKLDLEDVAEELAKLGKLPTG
ncbi:aldehyde ferredoxin oxidoreductase [Candidatus Bathyarchaeota archaeon]|mgnify:CR=1 FL=1|nr:MAG: aldehyde ferredoxin oxidoreductase [Candidatus Bathyarchaeota archaeon]